MKKTIVSILALVMLLGLMLVPVAAEWPEGACAVEITVEFVDCKPDDSVTLTFRDLSSWAGAPWAPYGNQALTFTAGNNVIDLMVPKKDISWMFGADFAENYWIVEAPEGYTVTPVWGDGDGNNPATKGHAKFVVTGKGAGDILTGTPVIDGKLDNIWAQSHSVTVDTSSPAIMVSNDGNIDSDIKAVTYFLHDDKYLYVAAVVTGDSSIVDNGSADWVSDSVEIWIVNANGSKSKMPMDAFGHALNTNGAIGPWDNTCNIDLNDSEIAAIRSENGYVVEMKVPLACYDDSNSTIGINVQLNNIYTADTDASNIVSYDENWNVIGQKPHGLYGKQYKNPTVYNLSSEAVKADPVTPPATGDIVSVFVALMAVSATGIAVLTKKKF